MLNSNPHFLLSSLAPNPSHSPLYIALTTSCQTCGALYYPPSRSTKLLNSNPHFLLSSPAPTRPTRPPASPHSVLSSPWSPVPAPSPPHQTVPPLSLLGRHTTDTPTQTNTLSSWATKSFHLYTPTHYNGLAPLSRSPPTSSCQN
ncbi:hypothetical protein Pmani_013648 [Petrolisthes manimaculis]|uniref:Uncharacterized protein n=1 Tax=Petrolisthes manimaculis TaxID=1843537 RepID=A0AAE1U956_9EUCA|nr:hypothetical protein Pmani_013648 [Petrolisthes manimaculis]